MFLVTVFLLALIAWLFFNGLNEKRWVEAHSHDESVASDKGFLPNFSTATRAMGLDDAAGGKRSIEQENTPFARAVGKVKAKTARYSDGLEKRAAAARISDDARPASAADENTFFGRMVKTVKDSGEGIGGMLDARMQAGRKAGEEAPRGGSLTEEKSFLGRAAARIVNREEMMTNRLRERYARQVSSTDASAGTDAAGSGESPSAGADGGVFNRMVGKVADRLEGMEKKVDAKLAKSRVEGADRSNPQKDDFIGRMAARVGPTINAADERAIGIVDKAEQGVTRQDGDGGDDSTDTPRS